MRIVFGLALTAAACAMACGSSSSNSGPSENGGGESKAGETSSSAGKGNSAGSGNSNGGSASIAGNAGVLGEGGEAGVGDPPIVSSAQPHAAGGLVAGGVVAHSSHFSGVFSLGAAPGGNGVSTSASRQLRGGVVGASQK